MAKIHEEIIVTKFSKLVNDTENEGSVQICNTDIIEAMTTVAQELVGTGVIVEVEIVK